MKSRFSLFLILSMYSPLILAEFSHHIWDELLKSTVTVIDDGKATQLDYSEMVGQRDQLREYLASLAEIPRSDFNDWSRNEQLAFLINAYNAWTVELVLTEHPNIESIKDIGFLFSSPWRKKIVNLFGNQISLDDIEHGMIRGWGVYKEPRIHFAVNCAAVGCPALRNEAYVAEFLEQQLDDNVRLFLSDSSRNYIDGNRLYVSKIFDWYEEDFEQGWNDTNSVSDFLRLYADEMQLDSANKKLLEEGGIRIRYSRYDWKLNDVSR